MTARPALLAAPQPRHPPRVPRAELEEQLRWYGIALTEEEEERIARGETVTFLVGADEPPP
jgi:hypothetical protein